ncbi:MAG TPA: hypothetical protein VNH38_07010 [Candidatus Dormibacteraeota bacterium]|nr:hypothetical protein [Candidatus Dormibacteraeota bacterium]
MTTSLPRRHRLLLRVYPPSFRERYGDELRALAEDASPSPRMALDLALGAARAWTRPTFGGKVEQRQRARLLATILTVFWSWSLVLLALASFSKMVNDPPLPGMRAPLTHAAFQLSQVAFGVSAALIGVGALLYGAVIAAGAWRDHRLRTLLPATLPVGVGLAWLGLSWVLSWWLLHFALGHRVPLPAAVGLVVLLLVWVLASVALAPICWVSIAVAMRRASLSVRLLRPGLIGAVAVVASLVVVVGAMAVTVASLGGPGGLPPNLVNLLLVYGVLPFAAVMTGIALISVRRGLRTNRQIFSLPPSPGAVAGDSQHPLL